MRPVSSLERLTTAKAVNIKRSADFCSPTKTLVLIVDDDYYSICALMSFFNNHLFEVTTAHNGLTAFDEVKALAEEHEQVHDLVFMDLKMPQCNGFDCTQMIRSYFREQKPHLR